MCGVEMVSRKIQTYQNKAKNMCIISFLFVFDLDGECKFVKTKHSGLMNRRRFCLPTCVIVPNFIKIGGTVADIWRFNPFFKMAAARHLEFVGRLLGPPTMTTWWSLSLCQIWLKTMQ